MKATLTLILLLVGVMGAVSAGDDASGPIHYSADLAQPFTTYVMSEKDNVWSRSLIARLNYSGTVMHFVRTSLALKVDERKIQGVIYESVENPDYFYIVNSDAMLRIGTRWAYNPGAGGFSAHAPKSRNFIVCLNMAGFVPFLSSSPVKKGLVTWDGYDWNRLESH